MDLNNREIAILIWVLILAGWSMSKAAIRSSLWAIVRILFKRQLLFPFLIMVAYIAACVYLLNRLNVWQWVNLKTTIIWAATFAAVSLFSIIRISEDKFYLRKLIRDIISITGVVAFIATFYVFSLPVELLLVPILTTAGAMHAVSQSQARLSQVQKFMGWLLAIVGLSFLFYSAYQIIQDFRVFASFATLREFGLPVILSLMFLPFIYTLVFYVTYERAFSRLNFAIHDSELRTFAKIRGLSSFRRDFDGLERWARSVVLFRPDSKTEVVKLIDEIRSAKRREARPPSVEPSQGWSPYIAKDFLRDDGLATRDYHRAIDCWVADSVYLKIGTGLIPNNISYHVEGDEIAATQLQLILNVHDSDQSAEAERIFIDLCGNLLRRSLNMEVVDSQSILTSLNGGAVTVVLGKKVQLTRQEWGSGCNHSYEKCLMIELGVQSGSSVSH